jgi:hypothetical protein
MKRFHLSCAELVGDDFFRLGEVGFTRCSWFNNIIIQAVPVLSIAPTSPVASFTNRPKTRSNVMECDVLDLDAVEIFAPSEKSVSPVCSYTEWDPLEEVIVGIVDGASFPPWHIALQPVLPTNQHETFRRHAGEQFPTELVAAAGKELEEFVHILEAEGVKVRRPEPIQCRVA